MLHSSIARALQVGKLRHSHRSQEDAPNLNVGTFLLDLASPAEPRKSQVLKESAEELVSPLGCQPSAALSHSHRLSPPSFHLRTKGQGEEEHGWDKLHENGGSRTVSGG